MALTPEEEQRKKAEMLKASVQGGRQQDVTMTQPGVSGGKPVVQGGAQPQTQSSPAKQASTSPNFSKPESVKTQSTAPGGGGGVAALGFGEKEHSKLTGKANRLGVAIATGGVSELVPGGGKKMEELGQKGFKVANDFLRKLDPTNVSIPKADTSRIEAGQDTLREIGSSAAQVGDAGRSLLANRSQFNVSNTAVGPAAQAQAGPDLSTGTVRGTTQQVSANTITPAQIAELERMQAAGISREDLDFRSKQMALANSLEQAAAGQGPSVANMQLQKANEDAIKAQAAIAASARGGNPVLAQRQAAQNVANLQQENAAKSAELKVQEQLTARGQLSDVLAQSRGQDIGVATSQAGLEQEAARVSKQAEDARALQQAELDQDAAKTTADLKLKADTFNSDQDFKAAMTDEERKLDAAKTSYLANIDVSKFNAAAKNEIEKLRVDSLLRTKLANQAAELQATGMGIDAIANQLGIQKDTAQSILASETQMFTAEQARLTSQKQAQGKMAGNILGAAASVVGALSDETTKKNVTPLNSSTPNKKNFSDVLKQSVEDGKAAAPIETASDGLLSGVNTLFSNKDSSGVKDAASNIDSDKASGIMSAISSMSDKTTKKKVKSDNPKIDALLSSLQGYEYEYKDPSMPGAAPGKRYGIMAQDLEKTPAGASIVKTDPGSGKKMIDVEQATGVLFASLARLNDKIDQLQAKKRK